MIKFPKYLIIGGVKWTVTFNKGIRSGAFYWHSHEIKIDKSYDSERRFQVLIHEVAEAILVNNIMRFQKSLSETNNGDYLFSFNHDQFEIFTDELAGIIKQIFRKRGEKWIDI